MYNLPSVLQKTLIPALFIILLLPASAFSQHDLNTHKIDSLQDMVQDYRHRFDVLEKLVDDLIWFQRVEDVAYIDKIYLTGPPKWKEDNPTAMGYGNPVKYWCYVFIPRDIDHSKKYPLLMLPHGGVHANFETYYTHIVRELIGQGYIVAAPEYRGSTGYGKSYYERIDYGGLENEDVNTARGHMLENYSFIDKDRVGILGWSHGGLISLMNVFEHPENYKVAFAGVPVSDLISRMGYQTQSYRELYSVDYHIGQTAHENVEEYKRRSPAWNAHKLETPLLIHTNTNDDDVNVLEVEHLIKSLKAEGKDFEYEIFQDIPGGHSFDRIDTRHARETRMKIYDFLGGYLSPPKPFKALSDLERAAYPGSQPK